MCQKITFYVQLAGLSEPCVRHFENHTSERTFELYFIHNFQGVSLYFTWEVKYTTHFFVNC